MFGLADLLRTGSLRLWWEIGLTETQDSLSSTVHTPAALNKHINKHSNKQTSTDASTSMEVYKSMKTRADMTHLSVLFSHTYTYTSTCNYSRIFFRQCSTKGLV